MPCAGVPSTNYWQWVDNVYWNGEEEEVVVGRVTGTVPSEPFQFAVLTEGAGERP